MPDDMGVADPLAGFSVPQRLERSAIAEVPDTPGVHVVWAPDGELLYAGESGKQRERLGDHLSGDRDGSVLHRKVGRRLDEQLGRTATKDEIRSFLESCTFAWKESDNRTALKALIFDERRPTFNEIRPSPPGTLWPWQEVPALVQMVLDGLRRRSDPEALADIEQLIEKDLPVTVQAEVGEAWTVRGRTGIGTWADVPWVGVFPASEVASAKSGVYVVFLFAADGSSCFLSLNQGTENVQGGLPPLQKRALDLRMAAQVPTELVQAMDLRSENLRPRKYTAASAASVEYPSGAVPEATIMRADLDRFLNLASAAYTEGLTFDPAGEPLHLLLKWSAERKPSTIQEHARIATSEGAVWWGKFGNPNTKPMSEARLERIRTQITNGVATHAYLYGAGELWRTNLAAITLDPAEVDRARMPDYYGTDACNLFVLLNAFEQVPVEWATGRLLLASNPNPEAMSGALGNQTSPLDVFERWTPGDHRPESPPALQQPAQPPPATVPLTMEWLERQTLWDRAELDEVLATLERRPQIVLAGPPGTSKTWIAKAIARYVTEDVPLAYRVLQFHPSYGYEEFIEGLRPVAEAGTVAFKIQPGAVLRTVDQLSALSGQRHVLILDEMNRANLPRVFGELMYLLEYRDESADLLYSQDFTLPKDLLFIGTMNTADRSIRSIDIALRRRFEIFDCPPRPKALERYYETASNEVPDLLDGFTTLNGRLTDLLDRHHTIGHGFFMADVMTPALLEAIWRRQLAPLIEEYFFDQPDVAHTFVFEDLWPSARP